MSHLRSVELESDARSTPSQPCPEPPAFLIPPISPLREYALPLFLLLMSAITTTAIGARFMQNFRYGSPTVVNDSDLWPWPWLLAHPSRFLLGWPFSFTLLGILLIHEFGHYFACRSHGVRATLPWVLPAPTLSGTVGAVIQIRGRIPNRSALMDVGIYGPIAGYAASLIAVTAGFLLSKPLSPDHAEPLITFGQPLTLHLVHGLLAHFYPGTPTFEAASRHPILIAGWVGLFITSLNLIPGGQLDGGHILYALSPRSHRALTYIIPAVLLVFGFFFWIGWILWGSLLLIPAMRHPRVGSDQPVGPKRRLLGWVALLLFALTFSPEPFAGGSIIHYLRY